MVKTSQLYFQKILMYLYMCVKQTIISVQTM